MMSKRQADAFVDTTQVVCPMTFVKVKVAIENLDPGQVLEVLLNAGELLHNVPRSLKEDGHKVLEVINNQDGTFTLYVERDGCHVV